jgi:hypothetical protein
MIKIILIVALIIALIIIGPLLTIWALNTLFPILAIPYTIQTWFAVVLIGMFIRAQVYLKGKE